MISLARAALHFGEEPCLVGTGGAGAVFFSGCPLHCVFCQNALISQEMKGRCLDVRQCARIFLRLQEEGAVCLDLVSGTPYIPQIIEALDLAKDEGFSIPVCWNTSAYERRESLNLLRDYVQIWLPDYKYFLKESAMRYSKAPDYPQYADEAIRCMIDFAGPLEFDEDHLLKKGVIVRILLLPGHLLEAKLILQRLEKIGRGKIGVSLMRQYRPLYRAGEYPEINRCVSDAEYLSLCHDAQLRDFPLICGQEKSTDPAATPAFDFTGLPDS